MILCINPNAAIDKTVIVSPFRINEIHRPDQVMAAPGGKGCNVARGLKRLGMTPVVTGWAGGFAGQFIEDGLRREGIQADFVQVDFESRTCLSIIDPENQTITELYEKGEPIPAEKVKALIGHIRSVIHAYEMIIFSGSLPPGASADFAAEVVEIARGARVPVLLDTSGEALQLGAAAGPRLIKPNRAEFSELLGRKPRDLAELAHSATEMSVELKAMVVVSLGEGGAIAADGKEVTHVRPRAVKIKSAVGSGDCLLAGIACGLVRSMSLAEAVRIGVAAGTANAMTFGAGVFSQEDFERVLPQVTVTSAGGN